MENKKKYSIHNVQNKSKKEHSQIDKVYRKKKGTTMYISALAFFLVAFFVIVFSPFFLGKAYDYETVELDNPQNISSSLNLVVDNMEINREKGLFKIVLRYQDDTGIKSLSNLKSEYKLNFINNKGKNEAKVKVIKVSDEFTTIYYENLPEDFGVISVSIEPRYVYPELEPSNDLENKEIKFYVVDKDIPKNEKMKIESESVLYKENFKYQIKSIVQSIDSEKENINRLILSNEILEKDIKKIESNLDFETVEEQTSSKTKISSMQTTIQNNEKQIKEIEEKINQQEEKIKHLEKVSSDFE